GPDRARFETLARATPAGARIHFEGFQPAPRAYLNQCALFVLASHAEPFGLVLAEARDAGCAIVATAVDGAPAAVDHGRAGVLVPARDPGALAAAMTRLLENDGERQRWRAAARENLDWLRVERQHEETMAVYAEALTT
ncbi:MAG: glycosyltransferase family 4 protein, partial [Gemmatimonadaceae bacterium]|nr:glycosyltransferase family 4 protein [Gemmatimonadaceae bacterium]